MSNRLQAFLTARAARPKVPVTNDAQPVTRAEYNTLLQAVHGLIEDVDAILQPGKIEAALSEAVTNALKSLDDGKPGARVMANGRRDHGFLIPPDDDDDKPVKGVTNGARIGGYLLPEGD